MAISSLPHVRLHPAPQLQPRGAEGLRSGANGAGNVETGASRTVPPSIPDAQSPRAVPAPHGLLNLQMDQIEALQGVPGDKGEVHPDDTNTEDKKSGQPGALTDEEEAVVRDMAGADREVRRHEQAHAAAGGAHAGAPSYQYEQGPDGKRYAVSGEVSIDTSPVQGDPKATIAKMQQVKAAANAPAQPSGQDRAVSAAATAISQQAQAELRAQDAADIGNGREDGDSEGGAEVGAAKFSAPGQVSDNVAGPPVRDIRPGSFTDISV